MLKKFKYIFIIILLTSLSAMSTPIANEPENVELNIQPSSPEELKKDRPDTISRRDAIMMRDLALMNQISNLDPKDIMIIRNQAMGSATSRMTMQIRNFAPEALVFYTAIGASMARKAYTDQLISGRRDPAWMENLMREINSPMGVFSFFCFLIASGQANYWLSQPLKPWSQKLATLKSIHDPTIAEKTQKEKNKAKKQRKAQQNKANTRSITPKKIHKPLQIKWTNRLHKSPTFNSYKTSRFGFRQSAFLITQMGLAAGILASDIITEIGTLMHNPAIHYCINHLLPDRLSNEENKLSAHNGNLICNEAYEESMATAKSWYPDVFSVVTSAMINHTLTQGLTNTLSWLIPGPGTAGKIISVVGHWSLRLFSLYTFMEINELVKHHQFHSWDANTRAEDLSDSIMLFMKNFDPQNQKKGLDCKGKPNTSTDCTYHPLIKQAISIANYFKRWRKFQSTPIEMARQNWSFYVSNTQAYFDLSYIVYKNLLTSQVQPNLLGYSHYFGPSISPNSTDSDSPPNTALNIPKDALLAFQTMRHKITTYLNHTHSQPIDRFPDVPLNIVSSISQSSFIKKNVQLNRVFAPFHSIMFAIFPNAAKKAPIPLSAESEQLVVLHKLFSAVDTSVSIEPFYDNWNQELSLAQKAVLKERSLQWATTCNQALDFIKLSQTTEQLRQENNELFLQLLSKSENSKDKDIETALKEYLTNIENQKDILNYCAQQKIKTFSLSDTPQQLIKNALEKQTWITATEVMEIVQSNYRQNPDQWRQDAETLLRKKVLAAGSQLLTQIIDQILTQNNFIAQLSVEEKEQITDWQNQYYPKKLIVIAQKLGPHHIFSQLFKELHRTDPDNGVYKYSIKPLAQGMLFTQDINQHYSLREQYFKMKYQPSQLNIFNTPGIMDFLYVSALCGPDLIASDEHQMILPKVKKVTSKEKLSAKHIALDEIFPDQDMDDIVQQLPVFKKPFVGGSFYFRPPKVIGLGKHKAAIQKLCLTAAPNEQAMHQDIYNSSFTVHGKTYNSLLQVALEHISYDTFPTASAFDKWWKEQVEPYRNLYLLLADREYLKMTKTWTAPLLFQNTHTQANSAYNITFTENSYHQQLSMQNNFRIQTKHPRGTALSNESFTLERMLPLSAEQGLFKPYKVSEHPAEQPYLRPRDETIHRSFAKDIERTETYFFSFSNSPLQNIHQEMNYWTDIILVLAQNSPHQEQITEYLIQFNELFNLPSTYWETIHANSMGQEVLDFLLAKPTQMSSSSQGKYLQWIDEFLREQTSTSYLKHSINICEIEDQGALDKLNNFQRAHLYLHVTACLLNVDMAVLSENLQASQIAMNVHDSLSAAEFTSTQDKQIGFFYSDSNQTLNQQLLNYTLITLKDLLLEASLYMDTVHAISDSKSMKDATQVPTHLTQ